MNDEKIVIVGGGIAGLTVAHKLHKAGLPVLLLEQSSHLGGCIRTMHESGYLLELGPNTFLNSSKELWSLAESVGIKNLKIETPDAIGKRRYIYKEEKLVAVPSGPKILFSPILSLKGRLRLLKEPFIKKPSHNNDESLASFVTRRLGKEALDMLVTPFVSGIYAGDPERLSIKAIFPKLVHIEQKYGSVIKGMKELKGDIKSSGLGSFRAGIGTLTSALASNLGDSTVKNARVTSIEKINDTYNVHYEKDGESLNVMTKRLICALPAYSAARVLGGISDALRNALMGIEYAPIIVVHTGYKQENVAHRLDGFGFLVPRKQRVRILGGLFSSSLFPERAPAGHALFTNFLGGELDREVSDLDNDEIMNIVQKDLGRTVGAKGSPAFACITRYTHAIAQYNIGHTDRIAQIGRSLENCGGLRLTGSYFTGISVAGTVEHAVKTADAILSKS